MRKLRSILLVDDDDATNYLNKRAIRVVDCADSVTVVGDGRRAIDYLTTPIEGACPTPDLILLDINMPLMNGWEFLDTFATLPAAQRAAKVIVMLSASLDPDDQARAEANPHVAAFHSKPLTEEGLRQILGDHFPGLERS